MNTSWRRLCKLRHVFLKDSKNFLELSELSSLSRSLQSFFGFLRVAYACRGVNSILALGGGVRDFCPAELEIALRKMTYMR